MWRRADLENGDAQVFHTNCFIVYRYIQGGGGISMKNIMFLVDDIICAKSQKFLKLHTNNL